MSTEPTTDIPFSPVLTILVVPLLVILAFLEITSPVPWLIMPILPSFVIVPLASNCPLVLLMAVSPVFVIVPSSVIPLEPLFLIETFPFPAILLSEARVNLSPLFKIVISPFVTATLPLMFKLPALFSIETFLFAVKVPFADIPEPEFSTLNVSLAETFAVEAITSSPLRLTILTEGVDVLPTVPEIFMPPLPSLTISVLPVETALPAIARCPVPLFTISRALSVEMFALFPMSRSPPLLEIDNAALVFETFPAIFKFPLVLYKFNLLLACMFPVTVNPFPPWLVKAVSPPEWFITLPEILIPASASLDPSVLPPDLITMLLPFDSKAFPCTIPSVFTRELNKLLA